MARPVGANSELTHQRILEAAEQLFTGGDPSDVSLRKIARLAEVSVGTIQHYFGSRGELYQACIDRFYMRMDDEVAQLMRDVQQLPTAELISVAVRRMFRFACAERGAVRMRMEAVVRTGLLEDEVLRHSTLPFLEEIARRLQSSVPLARTQLRIAASSIVHLVSRLAITEPTQLASLLGLPACASEKEVFDEAERFLTHAAAALLCIGGSLDNRQHAEPTRAVAN
ncbi:MAG: TetR/AcrR family transcriptional regulator [Deltaproteobacteria bacterium]|nr:TetR/AcrR family transcriptional regulator [Deltaproteobacteria bacterium]